MAPKGNHMEEGRILGLPRGCSPEVGWGCGHLLAALRPEDLLPRWLTHISLCGPELVPGSVSFTIGMLVCPADMAADFLQNMQSQRKTETEVQCLL